MNAKAPAQEKPTSPSPMSVLDGCWRLETLLGSGSYGHVYRARHLVEQRDVAIKIFHTPPQRAGYLQELGLFFQHLSPHMVQVESFGYSKGLQYLVYEYMPGGNLRNYLRRHPRLPLPQILFIAQEIAKGLAFIHEHRVVHRDLKPENILLTRSEWPFRVKLCDLGHARRCDPNAQINSSFGSMGYMAPEQYNKSYNHRVDFYALGVIVYEMLLGVRPSWRQEHVGAPPEAELSLPQLRMYPQELVEFFTNTLDPSPENRYDTIEELQQALLRVSQALRLHQYTHGQEKPRESSEDSASPTLMMRPQTQWKAKFRRELRSYCTTPAGSLMLHLDQHVLLLNDNQQVQALREADSQIEALLPGSDPRTIWGWQTDQKYCVQHLESAQTQAIPMSLFREPEQALLHPNSEQLLVLGHKSMELYHLKRGHQWLAEFESYGQQSAFCFSEEGERLWLTMEVPQPQLVAMNTDGEMLCRVPLQGRDICLLALDPYILVGAKGQKRIQLFANDGVLVTTVNLTEPLRSLKLWDENHILVEGTRTMTLYDKQTLWATAQFSLHRPGVHEPNHCGRLFGLSLSPTLTLVRCLELQEQ